MGSETWTLAFHTCVLATKRRTWLPKASSAFRQLYVLRRFPGADSLVTCRTMIRDEGDDALRREVIRLRAQVAELQRSAARHDEGRDGSVAEREELLREAERVMHLGTWTWDLQSGQVSWSDELYRILGLDPGTTPPSGEAFLERVHADDRARFLAASEQGLNEGIFPLLDHRLVRPDGSMRQVTLSSTALFDNSGRPRRIVGAVLDRTQSLGVEAELRRTLALLEEAQRFAQLGSWRFDPETRETEWSAEFRRIAGLSVDVPPSVPAFLERIHPDDQSRFVQAHQRNMSTPMGGQIDGRLLRPNGELRHVRVTGAVVEGASGRSELRGTMLDITEQVRMREELAHSKKMEAVGRLAAGIAHDFNNLLTIVTGNLELLHEQVGECPELDDSLRAVQSASNLTRRLLAFGRRAQLSLAVVEPNEIVRSTMSLLHRLVGDQIRLETQLAAGLPAIHVDALEIERALVNLVVNARDVVAAGGTVRIVTRAHTVDGSHWVELTVQDDGPGIAHSEVPHIFEPFYSTRVGSGGTGLGLATVLGTAEQHGGTVRVDTEPGKGSAFTIVLPGVEPHSREPSLEHRAVTPRTAVAPLRILVIDDEPMVAEAASRMLRSRGHRVKVETAPLEVLSWWRDRRSEFDIVVCDVVMPEMRGPELIARLSEEGGAPSVLFMSGYNEDETLTKADITVLAKPFTVSALEEAITRVLAQKSVHSRQY